MVLRSLSVVRAVVLAVLVSAGLVAQEAEFEVASIKLNTDARPPFNAVDRTFMRLTASGASHGRFTMRGFGAPTVSVLIQAAHQVKEFQVVGAPGWVNTERYDVDARAPGATTFEQMRPMLQSLLARRFRLEFRRESRPLPVYELVPARNGLKITPMKEGSCVPMEQAKPFAALNICGGTRRQIVPGPERRDVIEAVGVSMATLTEFLSEETGRIVLDNTGFTDVFNFRLEFESTVDRGSSPSGLSIFTAVEEQLGLRLRSTTGPVEVLVIDRVERPSPN